jgi:predicted lipid-binding transport protein (Tim44 family)
MMKNWLFAVAVVIASTLVVAPAISEAKRFGGGSSSGLQRSMPSQTPTKPAGQQQATPSQAPAAGTAPAAAAAKRSWMGPIAGLAAGLGIAALMSHLGLGEAFGNFLMLALLALAAVVAIRFLMRRFGDANAPQAYAGAGAATNTGTATPSYDKLVPAEADAMRRNVNPVAENAQVAADGRTLLSPLGTSGAAAGSAAGAAKSLPAGFDAEGFERIAKTIFIRMQAANDAGDLNDLRSFTTPEMFAVARLDLQDRKGKAQTTDVEQVEAEVLDLEQAGDRQVVSVRFHGKIREEADAQAEHFDEIWHLQRWGDTPSWAIAGIQQRH